MYVCFNLHKVTLQGPRAVWPYVPGERQCSEHDLCDNKYASIGGRMETLY